MFIYNYSIRYIMYYPFYIFTLQAPSSVNELIFTLGDGISREGQ
jgi:hypothetical protein